MREPFHVTTSLIRILALSVAATQTGSAMGEAATRAVLSANEVRVEADLANGRLRERYLAKTDEDAWVEVATSADVSGGPICLYGSGSPVGATHASPVRATEVSASANEMTETFSAGLCRIVRKISCEGNGPWLRVTTRLELSQTVELQSFADGFIFAQRAEWSYSPSVGGFNPDAQYKAPVILVQSKGLAFGIVPDVTSLTRDTLRLCHHALDLDVTAGPRLCVGFTPAKLARHSVYRMDAERAWKLEKPLENTYFLLVTATAGAGQAYRQCVRFHWDRFGRPSQSTAAEQQKGTGPYQGLALFDQWRQRVWEEESRKAWLRIVLPDGSIGGGASTSRALGPRSVYLSSWFNSLRTAFGMAGIEIDEEFLRDATIDVASGAAVGVNGLNITRCEIGEGKIAVEINSPFPWRREPVITFRNIGPSASYALVVNGITIGTHGGAELEKGIAVSLKNGRQ